MESQPKNDKLTLDIIKEEISDDINGPSLSLNKTSLLLNEQSIAKEHKEDTIEHKEDTIDQNIDKQNVDTDEIKAELQTIAKILLSSLLDNEKLTKFKDTLNISLDDKQVNLLNEIISTHPDFFKEIEELLNNIIRDNKIDSKDIPDIMLLLQKLYELLHNMKDFKFNIEKSTSTIGILTKFVINVFINEEIIKVEPSNRLEIQENLNKLIDVSMNLIKLTTTIKPTFFKDLFSCF